MLKKMKLSLRPQSVTLGSLPKPTFIMEVFILKFNNRECNRFFCSVVILQFF